MKIQNKKTGKFLSEADPETKEFSYVDTIEESKDFPEDEANLILGDSENSDNDFVGHHPPKP